MCLSSPFLAIEVVSSFALTNSAAVGTVYLFAHIYETGINP